MGILSGRPRNVISPDMEKLIFDIYGGGTTKAGISVNADQALRLITVYTCVQVLHDTVKQLPVHVMERIGDRKEKARDFPLYELIHYQPNFWMTAPEFWGMAEAHVALRGNFYSYKARLPGREEIKQLIPINPNSMEEVKQNQDYTLSYQVRFPNGDVKVLGSRDILHLRGMTLDGIVGVNPIEYIRESVGRGLAGEQFLSQFFSKGLHPGAVVEHPLVLNAKAHANLRQNLKEKYEGLGKSHEFMLIDEGMKISFPEIKLVDQQFLEQMKMTEAQICGVFRVPLMLIQSGDKTPTYASSEQFMISYVVHSLMPILVGFEMSMRRDLLTSDERKKYYMKFFANALLRGDFKTRMEGYQIGVNTEILSPNEVRDLEDMNPYVGGDEYRTRTSTVRGTTNETQVQK